MRSLLVAAAAAAVALTLAGCVAEEAASTKTVNDGFTPAATAETEPVEETAEAENTTCEYQADPSGTGPAVGLPPEEPVAATSLALTTSAGAITIQLDAQAAPCTVHSMAFLAGAGFFNNTTCHRLTSSEDLKVLQCGDPNGDGTGGPGYVVPDELDAAAALEPAEAPDAETQLVTYPRGIVAMANGGAGTTGSQFFLVYGDSTLPPNYTVIGALDEAGLATLDQIAAAGITPGPESAEDGAPTTPVTITTAVAS